MINDFLNKQIASWITDNLPLVPQYQGLSIHLDDLLHRDLDPSEVIPLAWQVFTCLLKQIQDLGMPVQPVVIIYLEEISNRIEKAIPVSPADIERQVALTPPEMYLIDWSAPRDLADMYRASLPANLFGREMDGVHISYREYRDLLSQQNDWEYARDIYIEYSPVSARPDEKR